MLAGEAAAEKREGEWTCKKRDVAKKIADADLKTQREIQKSSLYADRLEADTRTAARSDQYPTDLELIQKCLDWSMSAFY